MWQGSSWTATTRLTLASLWLLAVGTGCTAPIGTKLMDPRKVHGALAQSALSGDEPSSFTRAVLLRSALDGAYEDYPALTLDRMRKDIFWAEADDRLFALAELSFLHAERTESPEHYLAAAIYAYAFLFPEDADASPDPFDPRLRLASDLYNRGLTRGFADPDSERVVLRDGTYPLPFGEVTVDVDERDLRWDRYDLIDFQASADLAVQGLRNRYRHPGIGAPLAARTQLAADIEPPLTPVPNIVHLPVTALLHIEAPREGIQTGRLRGHVNIHAADAGDEIEVSGRPVPLEFETTAALASTLTLSRFWESELAAFFGNYGIRPPEQFGKGLFLLHPYSPGRIPLVLVHGTASSPGRWAELVNEVMGIPILRENFQVWLFTYDTGQPVSFSAGLLRESLQNAVDELDPNGRDPVLRNMVVIGHSQGGLLTKLTSVDSGDQFWRFEAPFEDLELDAESAHVLRRSLFFEPLPYVKRVVFIATPHGGSYLTLWSAAKWVSGLVTLPVLMVDAFATAVRLNPDLIDHDALDTIPTAIDNMTPSNPFLVTLRSLPIAPHVSAHSIIAVQGDGPVEEGADGVVAYESAHIEGVQSERVVRSGHSTQSHPGTIMEVGRILVEHLIASEHVIAASHETTPAPAFGAEDTALPAVSSGPPAP
ncbi:MAG: hypothetical protein AAF430_01550 [Myxococcota bacterium]